MERKERRLRLFLSIAITSLIFLDTLLIGIYKTTITPYAITTDDEVVCYVENKAAAQAAVSSICEKYTEDSNVKAINANVKIEKAEKKDVKEIANQETAAALVQEVADVTVVTTSTATEEYTPDPVYKQDDDMLAGQSQTIEESTTGEHEVTITKTSVNGETVSKTKTEGEVFEEGSPKVIVKGTRGLPDGEDWKTYEGYPECKDGEDIMKTAQSYIGKVPYVWGGKSLETGVDCSGFVMAIYRLYGVELHYPLQKEGIEVPYSEAKPGDILYFPGHFGLYLGDGKMVHASNPKTDVCIGNVNGRNVLSVRRIVK